MVNDVFLTGFIAPVFMIGALPMLHPFNACLGPDEYQRRTLTLAIESALMTTIMFGIMSFYKLDAVSAIITIGIGLIAWLIAYLAYWGKVKESGTMILKTGVIPKKEA
jgi:tetrahydromethanopterin S-methyltransferase subunit C